MLFCVPKPLSFRNVNERMLNKRKCAQMFTILYAGSDINHAIIPLDRKVWSESYIKNIFTNLNVE